MYNAYNSSSSSSSSSSRFGRVTGCCCGIVGRSVAIIVDLVSLVVVFAIILLIVAVPVPMIRLIYY
jgi:hypothetical protein